MSLKAYDIESATFNIQADGEAERIHYRQEIEHELDAEEAVKAQQYNVSPLNIPITWSNNTETSTSNQIAMPLDWGKIDNPTLRLRTMRMREMERYFSGGWNPAEKEKPAPAPVSADDDTVNDWTPDSE